VRRLSWIAVALLAIGPASACAPPSVQERPREGIRTLPTGSEKSTAAMHQAGRALDVTSLRAGEASLNVAIRSSAMREGTVRLGDEVLVCVPGASGSPRMRLVTVYCARDRERCAALVAGSSAQVSMTLASMDPQQPLLAEAVSAGCIR
jgi:hypothetical protein